MQRRLELPTPTVAQPVVRVLVIVEQPRDVRPPGFGRERSLRTSVYGFSVPLAFRETLSDGASKRLSRAPPLWPSGSPCFGGAFGSATPTRKGFQFTNLTTTTESTEL